MVALATTITAVAPLAAADPQPSYTETRTDAITGDNVPQTYNVNGVNCSTACYVPDSNPVAGQPVDNYAIDLYERPRDKGSSGNKYSPDGDIVAASFGFDAENLYFRLDFFGVDPASGVLAQRYGVEIDFDGDGLPDLLLEAEDVGHKNPGPEFGDANLRAFWDADQSMGGPTPLSPDGPESAGSGYEVTAFDQGSNAVQGSPGGSEAVVARVDPADASRVEFVVKRAFVDGLLSVEQAASTAVTEIGFRGLAAINQSINQAYYALHDKYDRQQMGSPHPWLRLDPAGAACPTTAAEEAALTPAQHQALDSGSETETPFLNPCFPDNSLDRFDTSDGTLGFADAVALLAPGACQTSADCPPTAPTCDVDSKSCLCVAGATELCDGIDNTCNGVIDEGCAGPDADGDGIANEAETQLGTDPNDADTDDDGVSDGAEPEAFVDSDGDGLINALDADSDNDGLLDGTELGLGCSGAGTDATLGHCREDADPSTQTDPLDADTDNGGASDGTEDANLDGAVDPGETQPTAGNGADDFGFVDGDGDGLGDDLEVTLGTDPADADSDDDGLSDGEEANPSDDGDGDGLVNALDPDSDDDGLADGTEVGADCSGAGTNAAAGHCRADADPSSTTSPIDPDTDDGGALDGSEDSNLDGKLDAGETDPTAGNGADDAGLADGDGDGLSDAVEVTLGSDPNDADSDDDGLPDGAEPNPSHDDDGDGLVSVHDVDSDDDALLDGTESGRDCAGPGTDAAAGHCTADADPTSRTHVLNEDTDGGGAIDGSEDANLDGAVSGNEGDPTLGHAADDSAAVDQDADDMSDALEASIGTSPTEVDSDADGVPDGLEPNPSDDHDGDGFANAEDPDSDDGGTPDGIEDADLDGDRDAGEASVFDPGDDLVAPCDTDDDCGDDESGLVCDTAQASALCVEGCRGTGGNGCPDGLTCSSTDETIGTCEPATTSVTTSSVTTGSGGGTSAGSGGAGGAVVGSGGARPGAGGDGVGPTGPTTAVGAGGAEAGSGGAAATDAGYFVEGNGLLCSAGHAAGASLPSRNAGVWALAALAIASLRRRRMAE